ncbi:MAG: acyl-CoA synthetase [Rhizobacter sp.]|nr:acyl-CoA synthetase [Rhizobacter sp.]
MTDEPNESTIELPDKVSGPGEPGEAAYLERMTSLWKQRWSTEVPREVHYPLGERPLTDYLRHWARTRPERAAVVFYGREMSWAELDRSSDRFAALLADLGLKEGDRVAVFLPNCPQFHVAFFGALKGGCVHVPVNPMFTAPELLYELNDTDATVIVAHESLLPLVEQVRVRSSLKHVFTTSFLDALPAEPLGTLPSGLLATRLSAQALQAAGASDLMTALREIDVPDRTAAMYEASDGSSAIPADSAIELDRMAAINYTGGTTGTPKGCLHTQRNMLYTGAVMSSVSANIGPGDVIIDFWPIFWVAGQDAAILLPVVSGATCVLLARWDPVAWLESVERHRATVAYMLVDNAVELLGHPAFDQHAVGSLRETLVASFVKKLNPTLRAAWREKVGPTLREAAWGMTETHSFDSVTRGFQHDDADLKARQVFCGLPVPGTLFKIMEFGSERLLPPGEEGELCVSSPSLFKGYWKRPDDSPTPDASGRTWLRTGDLGMIAPEGFLHFFGRRKEMLKVKGMSVFPAEIEAVLGQHAAVTGSGVIGRDDEVRGQVPVAFVTLWPEQVAHVTAADIDAFCRERLASYKIPEIRIVDALPMTATGKVRKEELKAQL